MCLELENAQEMIASVMSQRAAAEADAENARAAASRDISALTARVSELAAHLEAECTENATASARLKELASDNRSLQVKFLPPFPRISVRLTYIPGSCSLMHLENSVNTKQHRESFIEAW